MTFAIIDIGSNSVRLMLWADGKTLYKKVRTTRLGEGLGIHGSLSEEVIRRTAEAVCEFASEGKEHGAEVMAFATAAVRSAENGTTFCSVVKDLCGIEVDVVSGQSEARLAVLGALGEKDGGIIDIGGASTEICLIDGGKAIFSRSFDIGAVRLYDSCGENLNKLNILIFETLQDLPCASGKTVYAVGGTASTLACIHSGLMEYDANVLQDTVLTRNCVREIADRLFSLSVAERMRVKGMDPNRADILPAAALLLFKIMETMDLREVRFSDRDNLEGYLALKGLE